MGLECVVDLYCVCVTTEYNVPVSFQWCFVKKEYLPKMTLWAVFAVAIIIVIQCIFTDILVFTF